MTDLATNEVWLVTFVIDAQNPKDAGQQIEELREKKDWIMRLLDGASGSDDDDDDVDDVDGITLRSWMVLPQGALQLDTAQFYSA